MLGHHLHLVNPGTDFDEDSQGMIAPELADVAQRAGACTGLEFTVLERLGGGTSGYTFVGSTATGSRSVIKMAPRGLPAVGHRDMVRQAVLLVALFREGGIPVPRVLGRDPGAPPESPPLFVMEYVDGESYEPRREEGRERPPGGVLRDRGKHATRLLAHLHRLDLAGLGIVEPARPLEWEVQRWQQALSSCPLNDDERGLAERAGHALQAHLPRPVPPTLLHGDWRLGNLICRDARVVAALDWEIWSVGDPRFDLAWFRLMSDPAHPTSVDPAAPALEPDEIRALYRRCGGSVQDQPWFDAWARYKQAGATALLVKHADRRGEPSPRVERMRTGVGPLLAAAITGIGG